MKRPMRGTAAQRGVALLEALIAVLVFSIGILALIGLQAFAVKSSADAKYRADASYLASQVINQVWVDQANIANYALNANAADCAAGAAPGNAHPAKPLIDQAAALLPGAAGDRQRIVVNVAADPNLATQPINQVTVTLCWKGPQENDYHNYVATARVSG